MKSILLLITILATSLFSQASSDYIACKDLKSPEYNILLKLENSKVVAYSTLELDFKTMIDRVTEPGSWLYVTYVEEYDTKLSYDVFITDNMLNRMDVTALTSGNDSDNYIPVAVKADITCHQLKAQPTDSIFKSENYLRTIPTISPL